MTYKEKMHLVFNWYFNNYIGIINYYINIFNIRVYILAIIIKNFNGVNIPMYVYLL